MGTFRTLSVGESATLEPAPIRRGGRTLASRRHQIRLPADGPRARQRTDCLLGSRHLRGDPVGRHRLPDEDDRFQARHASAWRCGAVAIAPPPKPPDRPGSARGVDSGRSARALLRQCAIHQGQGFLLLRAQSGVLLDRLLHAGVSRALLVEQAQLPVERLRL